MPGLFWQDWLFSTSREQRHSDEHTTTENWVRVRVGYDNFLFEKIALYLSASSLVQDCTKKAHLIDINEYVPQWIRREIEQTTKQNSKMIMWLTTACITCCRLRNCSTSARYKSSIQNTLLILPWEVNKIYTSGDHIAIWCLEENV